MVDMMSRLWPYNCTHVPALQGSRVQGSRVGKSCILKRRCCKWIASRQLQP